MFCEFNITLVPGKRRDMDTRWGGLVCLVWLLTGCHGGLRIPDGWSPRPVENRATSRDHPETGRMQVYICYGEVFSNHTALRLVRDDGRVLFWDPGGYYLEKDPRANRKRDLILDTPPTPEQWWEYRRDGCSEPFMLGLEWDLPPPLSERLYNALVNGNDANSRNPTDRAFQSDTPGMMCCIAVCDFLQRFATEIIAVPQRWLLPHDLANHLWTQSPDRVYLYREGHPMDILYPPGPPGPPEP